MYRFVFQSGRRDPKLSPSAVILSFLGGALIARTVMWALAEMTAEHPAAGSFGLHAEIYLHPWAGFAIRYTYWLGLAVPGGSAVAAAAIYCKLWFPGIPTINTRHKIGRGHG